MQWRGAKWLHKVAGQRHGMARRKPKDMPLDDLGEKENIPEGYSDFYPALAIFSYAAIMCLLAFVVFEFKPGKYHILILSILIGAIILASVFFFYDLQRDNRDGLPARPKSAVIADYVGCILLLFGYGCFSIDIVVLLSAIIYWAISLGNWPKWWILSSLGVASSIGIVAVIASIPIASWLVSKYGK